MLRGTPIAPTRLPAIGTFLVPWRTSRSTGAGESFGVELLSHVRPPGDLGRSPARTKSLLISAAYPAFPPSRWVFGYCGGQGSAGVGPAEPFGEGTVEVFDELEQAVFESRQGRRVATSHNTPSDDSKCDLDRIEPRRMLR